MSRRRVESFVLSVDDTDMTYWYATTLKTFCLKPVRSMVHQKAINLSQSQNQLRLLSSLSVLVMRRTPRKLKPDQCLSTQLVRLSAVTPTLTPGVASQ